MQYWKNHRESWLRSKDGVTILHDGIGHRKLQIPKLYDIIPSTLRKGKRVGIKFKKFGYESILIGGVSADINR